MKRISGNQEIRGWRGNSGKKKQQKKRRVKGKSYSTSFLPFCLAFVFSSSSSPSFSTSLLPLPFQHTGKETRMRAPEADSLQMETKPNRTEQIADLHQHSRLLHAACRRKCSMLMTLPRKDDYEHYDGREEDATRRVCRSQISRVRPSRKSKKEEEEKEKEKRRTKKEKEIRKRSSRQKKKKKIQNGNTKEQIQKKNEKSRHEEDEQPMLEIEERKTDERGEREAEWKQRKKKRRRHTKWSLRMSWIIQQMKRIILCNHQRLIEQHTKDSNPHGCINIMTLIRACVLQQSSSTELFTTATGTRKQTNKAETKRAGEEKRSLQE